MQDCFPILHKVCSFYYFRAALKRIAFNSKAKMCYLMRTKNIILPYPWTYGEVTLLFIKWMTLQGYNNTEVLLFPLQIWKQSYQPKCSDQFGVNKQDTDCFEHLHKGNTKPSVNVSVLHAWIFLMISGFLWFLQRGV